MPMSKTFNVERSVNDPILTTKDSLLPLKDEKKFESSMGTAIVGELSPALDAHSSDVLGRKWLASKLDLLNARTN
jgi:hypothetical protein